MNTVTVTYRGGETRTHESEHPIEIEFHPLSGLFLARSGKHATRFEWSHTASIHCEGQVKLSGQDWGERYVW